jgi:hypothetical protein
VRLRDRGPLCVNLDCELRSGQERAAARVGGMGTSGAVFRRVAGIWLARAVMRYLGREPHCSASDYGTHPSPRERVAWVRAGVLHPGHCPAGVTPAKDGPGVEGHKHAARVQLWENE